MYVNNYYKNANYDEMSWDNIWYNRGTFRTVLKLEKGNHLITFYGSTDEEIGTMDIKFELTRHTFEVRSYKNHRTTDAAFE